MNERDIFITALEKPTASERNAYLDEVCQRPGVSRSQIEALLREQAQLGAFLETPAGTLLGSAEQGADIRPDQPQRPPGSDGWESRVLGDFRILREIGRGGMGIVYEAEQISLGRRMALKVLPFASVLDERHLTRFRNEARAAASLKHPHIVGVHSVGCERGVHYYAMEYIEGQTLTEVIHQLRKTNVGDLTKPLSSPPEMGYAAHVDRSLRDRTPRLGQTRPRECGPHAAASPALEAAQAEGQPPAGSTAKFEAQTLPDVPSPSVPRNAAEDQRFFRQVAQWGIQAAEGLEHAHQMGIVHRDIKPSNLLVDGTGHLWITDFGLAHVQTDANLTLTGDVLGTLRYMSPEQASGRTGVTDHHTDIYSLGVTLYELLTLQPPFPGNDRQSVLRRITEEEPSASRDFSKSIPKDLETIVLKAMAKEPQTRYASAQQMAEDLRRFVADEPIRARRPTLAERASKWSRRHRPLVWSAVAVLLLSTIGSLASVLLIAREQKRTAQAYQEKTQQLVATDRAEKLARQQEQLAKRQERLAREQRQLAEAQKEEAVKQHDNPNGTLDTSFGPGHTGIVTSDFSSYDTADGRAVAVDAAGDIFVGGYVHQAGGVSSFAVAEYDPNGNLVTTFGTGGLATATFNVNGVNVSAGATGIALGPDGTIVLAGGTTRFAVARFTSAGELDTTFGGTGMVTSTVGSLLNPSVSGMFLQPQTNGTSKIVVGGQGGKYMLLARLNWDGSFDASFGVPAVAAGATSAAPLANATLGATVLSAPAASPTQALVVQQGVGKSGSTASKLVFNGVAQTAGTTEPSTGRDTKELQFPKRDYLAVDAAIGDLQADLLADELAAVLVP